MTLRTLSLRLSDTQRRFGGNILQIREEVVPAAVAVALVFDRYRCLASAMSPGHFFSCFVVAIWGEKIVVQALFTSHEDATVCDRKRKE